MSRTSLFLLVVLWLGLAIPSAYSADIDPAAQAATIAPYLDEQAFAVVHVDLSRIDLVAARKYVEAKLPELLVNEKEELGRSEANATGWLMAWQKAGVVDAYMVASLTDTPRRPPFFVVPLQKGADAKTIGELMFPKPPGGAAEGAEAAPFGWEVIRGNLCLGHNDTLARLKDLKPTEHPHLAQAFKAAGDSAVQAVLLQSGDTRRVLEQTLPALPGPLSEFSGRDLAAVDYAAVGIDLPPKPVVKIELRTSDAASAAQLRNLARTALAIGKEDPGIAKAMPRYDELVKLLTPAQQDNRLSLILNEENDGVAQALALTIPPVQSARAAARRMQSSNNLKQLAIAMHIYHDAHKHLPPAHTAKDGKPLLSWRVAILPYLEQQALYDQFHHDEPWDSEHNKALVAKMPELFASPGINLEPGHTTYLVPTGKSLVFDGERTTSLSKITDGLSNTIMIVEAEATSAVPWTKPAELEVDLESPHKGVAKSREKGFYAAICDGSVRFISSDIAGATLRKLFEIADGLPVDAF